MQKTAKKTAQELLKSLAVLHKFQDMCLQSGVLWLVYLLFPVLERSFREEQNIAKHNKKQQKTTKHIKRTKNNKTQAKKQKR